MDTARGRSRSRSGSGGRAVRARSGSRARPVMIRRYKAITLKGVHTFERTIPVTMSLNQQTGFTLTSGLADGKYLSMIFSLQTLFVIGSSGTTPIAVPNSADFTNLFDHWRINHVTVKILAASNISSTSTPTQVMPTLWVFNDTDDSTLPTTLNQFLERENVRTISFTDSNIKQHKCYPKTAVSTFQGVVPAYSEARNVWCDTEYPATNYYGIKMYYDTMGNNSNTAVGQLEFLVTYNMSFKGVR